jgi:S1-C subfamily serine protease
MPHTGNVRHLFFSVIIAGLATALFAAGPPTAAKPADPPALVRQVAEAGIQRTVGISCSVEKQAGFYGTGAVITPDGHIITSTTVVPAGADEIKVYFDGPKILKAKIVETNKGLEATLLKVDAKDLACFPVAREMPAVGQRAFTFSNANDMMGMGSRAAFSMGVFSGVYEVEDLGGESGYHGPAIETSAAVNPGSDGGPIVNQCGQLCGILSLNSSPRRWQGISVPIMKLLEQFTAVKTGKLKLSFEPLAAAPAAAELESLAASARDVSGHLVGVTVQRKFPAEVLPRISWDNYRQQIKDWDKLSPAEKLHRQDSYTEVERLLEANQILRRPPAALTGMIISPEGHILTSAFNVGDDIAFKDKASGKPPTIAFRGTEDDLVKETSKDLAIGRNPIEKILVTLPDGSQREAKLLARHEPLGVALLKIDAKGLKFCDLAKQTAQPELGTRVGLLGYMGGKLTRHTLDPGIVSSPSRDRGMRFQIDALLNYGNSGGPVISAQGRLLGIGLAPIVPHTVIGRVFDSKELEEWITAPNSGVSMVCRMDRLLPVVGELKAGKSTTTMRGALLGVMLDPRRALSDQVVIGEVLPGSPADKAGLKAGDRIVKLNHEPLGDWKDLTDHVSQHQPGDKIELEIYRKNIDRHLFIKGQNVANEADLRALVQKLKPGEEFRGTLVQSDTKVVTVTLGEVK